MSDISAIASSAVAINQSQQQVPVTLGIIRMNAQAEQAVVGMLMQNAQQVKVLSGNIAGGGIDLYV
jgi:hypothetical protein